MKPIRVLHCPTSVGGNPQGLVRAERELGLQSWAVVFKQNYFAYQTDEVLSPQASRVMLEIKRWILLWRALRDYDVIHFNFGQTILPSLLAGQNATLPSRLYRFYAHLLNMNDLALLRRAGKGIVVTFQGDDARQGDYSRANFDICIAKVVDASYYTPASDVLKRRIISKFACYADRIFYLNPDLAHVLPVTAIFIPYAHIDPRNWQVEPTSKSIAESVTVIHAPTHREAKGTSSVLEAIHRLQEDGLSFQFILVEKMPHYEARELYKRADLLVDQLYAGWYGGLAVEFMALGKPVICYIRESDLKFLPEAMRQELPIINATPATIYTVLKEWLTARKPELAELGRRSRAYVEKWHDPLKVAAMLKREYEAILETKLH